MTMNSKQIQQNNQRFIRQRSRNKEEMKHQVILYLLMMIFTIFAFVTVAYDAFPVLFKGPFILLLALVQVIFQLFYFMHMKHKGHEAPTLFLFSGIGFSFIMAWSFLTIIWW